MFPLENPQSFKILFGYHNPTQVTKFYMTSSTFIRFEQISGAAVCLSCLERVHLWRVGPDWLATVRNIYFLTFSQPRP